jgi:hypothetical protein
MKNSSVVLAATYRYDQRAANALNKSCNQDRTGSSFAGAEQTISVTTICESSGTDPRSSHKQNP